MLIGSRRMLPAQRSGHKKRDLRWMMTVYSSTLAPYKRPVAFLLALALLLVAAVGTQAQGDVADVVLTRINRARANANSPALIRSAQLDSAAQAHADDLVQHGSQLGHRGSDGSTVQQRIARTGYNGRAWGENW